MLRSSDAMQFPLWVSVFADTLWRAEAFAIAEHQQLARHYGCPHLVIGERRGGDDRDLVVHRRYVPEVDRHVLVHQMRGRERRPTQDVTELVGAVCEQVFAVTHQIIEPAVTAQ